MFYYKCRNKGCSCNKSAKKLHGQFEELLKQFEIDPDLLEHIAPIMKYKFEEITKSNKSEEKLLKRKKTELENKLEAMEERFAIGEIGSDVYNKYRTKYAQELEEIDQNLEVPDFISSNHESKFSVLCYPRNNKGFGEK